MAAVALTPINVDRTGTAATGAGQACSAGSTYTFSNSGNQVVRFKSTATDVAITAAIPTGPDDTTSAGKTTPALTASSDGWFGPFPVGIYGTTVTLSGPVATTTTLWVVQFVPSA